MTNRADLGRRRIDRIMLADRKGHEFSFYGKLHKDSGKVYVDMSKADFTVI